MKSILSENEKNEVDEILNFLKALTIEEKREFKNFMDGVKFAKAYKNDELKSA